MSELFFVTAIPHWFVRFIIATIRFLEPWATAFVHLDDELCGAPPPPPPSPHLFSIKSHEHNARHTHHKPNYSSSHARREVGMGHGRGTARRSLRSCGPAPTTVWSSAYGGGANESSFLNLAHASSFGSLEGLAKAGMYSMISPFQCVGDDCSGPYMVFHRGHKRGEGSSLIRGWEAKVDSLIAAVRATHTKRGNTLIGAFLGDELCCHSPRCMNATLQPVASRLKAALHTPSRTFIIWVNECSNTIYGLPRGRTLPHSIDLLSINLHGGDLPNTHGDDDEVAEVRAFFAGEMFPRMHIGQRTLVVPGLSGCSNLTSCGTLEVQEGRLLEKLTAYKAYLHDEPRHAGLAPWHLRNRTQSQHGMRVGAEHFPRLMAAWREYGASIINRCLILSTATHGRAIGLGRSPR